MPGHTTYESKGLIFNKQETNFNTNNFISTSLAEVDWGGQVLGESDDLKFTYSFAYALQIRVAFENQGNKFMKGYDLLLVFKKFKGHRKRQYF